MPTFTPKPATAGAKVAAVAPDYAEYVKFADTWLPARAGTDGALAMAMTRVVMQEFYLDRQVPYFVDYAKTYTDLPFLVVLEPDGDRWLPGRFLRASDLSLEVNNADWKPLVFDAHSRGTVIPNGSIGFRWEENGRWNLKPEDSQSGEKIDPLLGLSSAADEWVTAAFPIFGPQSTGSRTATVPVKKLAAKDGELRVTTVFDLMAANLGLYGGTDEAAKTPPPYTPAWQEAITGVPRLKTASGWRVSLRKTPSRPAENPWYFWARAPITGITVT
jgi:nitrate reductase / nitrite oxidoreductase, alpha subunit